MKVATEFNIGDKVFVVNDSEQFPYFVVGIRVLPSACVIYELKYMDERLECYEFELTKEKQIILE
jgi:hypothetical protein